MIDTKPVAFEPDDLYYCDEDDDGFGTFNLNEADNQIIGGNPSGNLEVSYHLTLTDAENDVMQLQSPYENIVPDIQILYARLNNTFTGCFDITQLRIRVFEFQPVNTNPDDLVYVEPNSDGIGIFDLTNIEPEVLSGIMGTIVLSYFEEQGGINPINSTQNYVNTSNPQTIYMTIRFIGSDCMYFAEFDLVVYDEIDLDGDGVPNDDEDLNNNGDLEDDDTDGDGIPNYLDSDDDGDNVETIDETQGIGAGLGPQIFIDTDGDMIENYLDDDDDGDGVLTKDEDYNGNGDPIDDDTNNNDIPDFLDEDVALGVVSQDLVGLAIFPNPAKDLLNISLPNLESNATITIYSIQGKQLFSEILNTQATAKNIDVASLQSGVYFIKIETQNGSLTKKFVKE